MSQKYGIKQLLIDTDNEKSAYWGHGSPVDAHLDVFVAVSNPRSPFTICVVEWGSVKPRVLGRAGKRQAPQPTPQCHCPHRVRSQRHGS